MYDAVLNSLLRDLATTFASACPDDSKVGMLNTLVHTLPDDSPLAKTMLSSFLADKHDSIANKNVASFAGTNIMGVDVNGVLAKLDAPTLNSVFDKLSAISMILKLGELIPEDTARQLSAIAESFVSNIANDPEAMKSTVTSIMSMLSASDMSSLLAGLLPSI